MKKIAISLLALAVMATQSAFAEDGAALFKAKTCAACHSVDMKLVGPAFKAVAAKYADQEDAMETLITSITAGSTGKWGPIPMPANNVTDEEAKVLATWILQQK